MALSHSLGFPRIGADRELKKALEAHWKGELDEAGLQAVGRELRAAHWQVQKDAGIDLLPVGDFAWYDQMLSHSLSFGVIPERFRPADGKPTLDTLFAMARGVSKGCCAGAHAQEMTKWFDTNYHYLVPEFSADQQFQLSWTQLFEEVEEAHALGHRVKPVLIGPLTYLWLGKAKGGEFERLDLLERLLPVYGEILQRLAAQGVEWVQIDEPILALDLPQDWKNAFERAYNLLQREPGKKLIATYFAGLEDNLGLAASLPVDGLHIDLVRAPEQFPTILDRLPAYKVLSLGVVNGRNVWRTDLHKALDILREAQARLGSRLWVAPSCSLLHSPVDLSREDKLDAELKSWLAFAVQKCEEVALLTRALNDPQDARVQAALATSAAVQAGRAESPRIHKPAVQARLAAVTAADSQRQSPFAKRIEQQRARLQPCHQARVAQALVERAVHAKQQGRHQRHGQHAQIGPHIGPQFGGHLGPRQPRVWEPQTGDAQRCGDRRDVQRLAHRAPDLGASVAAMQLGPDRQQRLQHAVEGHINADVNGRGHGQHGQRMRAVTAGNDGVSHAKGHDGQLPDQHSARMAGDGAQLGHGSVLGRVWLGGRVVLGRL